MLTTMGKHKRREGYWKHCESATREEGSHVKKTLLEMIWQNPHPRESGGRAVHPSILESRSEIISTSE